MSIEQMREALMKSYPSQKWQDKVRKMSDKQIFAIYTRMLNAKQL